QCPGCSRKDLGGAKGASVAILLGKDGIRRCDGPGDSDLGVVPDQGALACGAVVVGDLVGQAGIVGERGESVAESDGDVEGEGVLRGELDRNVASEVWRVAAQVYRHVEDRATGDAYKLGLRLNDLVVDAADHV